MSKVFITSLKAGSGHLRAAQALEKAFHIKYPDFKIMNLDLLDYSSTLLRFLYGNSYIKMVQNFPDLYSYLYKKYKGGGEKFSPRLAFERVNANNFLGIFDEFNPDFVIATNFICGSILADYKKKENKKYPIYITITDYEVHPIWTVKSEEVDRYSVAHEEMKHNLTLLGVPKEKIVVTGIPVDPIFLENKNKEELRKKYQISENVPTILLSGGSFGTTSVEKTIDYLKFIENDFQLVVICGKNKKLYEKIRKKQGNDKRIKLVFEFVDFMDELMRISDVIITKPGGITTSESLTLGLPMILVEPIPGQEEANVDYFLEKGAGVKARNAESLIFKLNNFLENPQELEKIKANISKIARSKAALDIVEDAVNNFL